MPPAPETFDAIVLGAGAAGMMCAAVAGQRGRRVVLVDHAAQAGKKILISGGGRCNFTNIHTRPECFLSQNPHFAKSALGRYLPAEFIALVERHGIAWHEKTLGQLFCDGSARQIVAMLLDECARGGVQVRLGAAVGDVTHADARFRVSLPDATLEAPALVLATGGPSIPKMGATGFAYDVARRFGLDVVPPRPALVPFTLGPDAADFTALAGVSATTVARCGKARFRKAFLFTHRGLSGPAILQVSSYWSPGEAVSLDLAPDHASGWLVAAKRERPRASLRAALAGHLPDRLAQVLAARLIGHQTRDDSRDHARNHRGRHPGADGGSGDGGAGDGGSAAPLATLPDRTLARAEADLANWVFRPAGTEGFAKAEVTAGGIATSALSSRTMAARTLPGLFAIGECVDVTGWLGGYNFQWAWASGAAAGQAL